MERAVGQGLLRLGCWKEDTHGKGLHGWCNDHWCPQVEEDGDVSDLRFLSRNAQGGWSVRVRTHNNSFELSSTKLQHCFSSTFAHSDIFVKCDGCEGAQRWYSRLMVGTCQVVKALCPRSFFELCQERMIEKASVVMVMRTGLVSIGSPKTHG